MRVASIAFPFRPTFQRLELEKRWWHRLCVVIFFVVLLFSAVFTTWVTYSVFAPQVATMPDIVAIVDTAQKGLSTQADVEAILTANDRSVLQPNVRLPPSGYHLDRSISLKQLGRKIKAIYPVYNTLDDEALARGVVAKYPQYNSVVSDAGFNKVQIDPKTGERISSTTDHRDVTTF